MSWISNIFFVVLLMSITGSIACIIWRILNFIFEKINPILLYDTLKFVGIFFVVPIVVIIFISNYHGRTYFVYWADYLSYFIPNIERYVSIGSIIWLVGFLVVIYHKLIQFIAWRRHIKGRYIDNSRYIVDTVESISNNLNIKRKLKVYRCHNIQTPLITGLIKPIIILPDKVYSQTELWVMLTHELTHYKRKDTYTKAAFLLIAFIHYFNPTVYYISNRITRYSEFNCDVDACRWGAYLFKPSEYFGAILNQVNDLYLSSFETNYIMSTLFENKHDLERRIDSMKRYKMSKFKSGSMAAAAMIIVFCLGLGSTSYAAGQSVNGNVDTYIDSLYIAGGIEEEQQVFNDDTEYTVSPDESRVTVIEGKVGNAATKSVTKSFSWTVTPNTRCVGPKFTASSGGTIYITSSCSVANKSYRMGIVEPDGMLRYVSGVTAQGHTFTLDQSGTYEVFIENTSDTTCSYSGFYRY